MSDANPTGHHSHSFVRREMLSERAAPVTSSGPIGWVINNLFNGVANSILTVVSAIFIYYIVSSIAAWAWSPTWNAQSLTECREILSAMGRTGHFGGACWGVINERWVQFLFGFYPAEAYWRPILAFFGLFLAIAPVLFSSLPRKLLWFSALYPFLAVWLLWGGSIWSPVAVLAGIVGSVGVAIAASARGSQLLGMIAGVVFFVFAFFDPLSGLGSLMATAFGASENLIPRGGYVDAIFPLINHVGAIDNYVPIGIVEVESRLFGGFLLAFVIGVSGIALSLPIGVVLALGRQSDLIVIKAVCVGFIEFIRGVPLITLLFVASTLLNIFMPPGTNFDIVIRVIIMVTLFASAYMAEVIRGGLAALPTGQYEAADSLGLDYWKAQRLIIMPQALKISIPGIVNTFIGLFKDTVLVSVIGLLDPLGLSTNIRADVAWNGILWELYGFIALIFFIICFGMSRYSMYLERKLATDHR